MQEESSALEKAMTAERERSKLLQRDLAASLRDSKEALHREVEIMAQLEQQDEVPPACCFCCVKAGQTTCHRSYKLLRAHVATSLPLQSFQGHLRPAGKC